MPPSSPSPGIRVRKQPSKQPPPSTSPSRPSRKSRTQTTPLTPEQQKFQDQQELELPQFLKNLGLTRAKLEAMDAETLREVVRNVQTLSRRLHVEGPQSDDELHSWIKREILVDIPRVAVCEGHTSPFNFLADVYFYRVGVQIEDEFVHTGALARANRGGAKTFIVAIIHYLNATYKPGYEGLSFGATEAQGNRCYSNVENWCYIHDDQGRRTDDLKPLVDGKPKRSETNFLHGSKIEVVAGTETAVSGPHPQLGHSDEIEQMDAGTWTQSRGMAVSKQAAGPLPAWMSQMFKEIIPAQDVATSTMNSKFGRMAELRTEIDEDQAQGNIPQYVPYDWCIVETTAEVASCRKANTEEREARLKELGRDPNELCHCHRVPKGRNSDLTVRTLEQTCAGRFFKSRGWKPYSDLVTTYKRNTPGTWLLQHECREGQDENAYIQGWSLSLYGLRGYEPKPQYGRIYQGVDWGGTNPHAVIWFQYLTTEVPAFDFNYEPIYLKAGIYVAFKEIYVADIDTGKLARRVIGIENAYRNKYGRAWKVRDRFCDPQGKGDRLLFARKGLKSSWPVVTRQKDKMITNVQNLVADDRWAVDVEECPMTCEETEQWSKNPRTGVEIDLFNHAMSAWRYGISNAEVREGNLDPDDESGKPPQSSGEAPHTSKGQHKYPDEGQPTVRKGPVATRGGKEHATDQFKMR